MTEQEVAAVRTLIERARIAACYIATYKPKHDLLDAVQVVEEILQEDK